MCVCVTHTQQTLNKPTSGLKKLPAVSPTARVG